jgi:hypothetical protein
MASNNINSGVLVLGLLIFILGLFIIPILLTVGGIFILVSIILFATSKPIPSPPVIVTVEPRPSSILVSFTSIDGSGSNISYTATAKETVGGAMYSSTKSYTPILITGLVTGRAYTCTVTQTNENGTSLPSAPSASVTPT